MVIQSFSVKYFDQLNYTDYANETYLSSLKPLNQFKPNLAGMVSFIILFNIPTPSIEGGDRYLK